jgi:dihydroorotase/N-acyl-D-amino-acid deacylase
MMSPLPRVAFIALLAAAVACAPATRSAAAGDSYDVLITGGEILDGTGAPAFRGDIAVSGGRIVRVSRAALARSSAARVIDASGLTVAPGFIDLHAHLDPLLRLIDMESSLRQGVTTAVGGPDGGGPWPFGVYLDSVEKAGPGANVAFLVGHNTIRREVMGLADRAPAPDELERMRRMIGEALGEGAFGMSTGLRYLPGTFATTDEVVALSKVASDSGGIYTSHLREEGLGLFEGVAEAIRIAREADIRVVLTHHKAVGQKMWGESRRTLAMVDSARAMGLDVRMDQYPYTATSTGIAVLIPSWALAGGDSAFARRTRDPVLRDSIMRGIVFNLLNDRGGGDLRRVQFARVAWDASLEGKTLHDWVVREGLAPTPENGASLVIEAELRGGASGIYHVLDEEDVERIMRHPMTSHASDGRLSKPGEGVPHPRGYGTFPRVLGVYVRDRGVLTLPDAVRKMTSLPAATLNLDDRGRVAEGLVADLVIFDPARVADQATFVDPHQYPAGIPWVLVNGRIAVENGRFIGRRAGAVLRRRPGRSRD